MSMRKIVFLLLPVLLFVSCASENKDPQYEGEFIYLADAAVLKGEDFIYGVTVDEKMQELADKVAPIKKEEYDMIPVIVKGKLTKKKEGEEGWDEILTITEIVEIGTTPSQPDVKIEENK